MLQCRSLSACGLICNRFNRDTDLLEDAQMRPAADVRRGSDDQAAAVYFMIVSPSFRKVVGVLFIGAVALFGWFLIHNPDTPMSLLSFRVFPIN
jgi:hypothetical protein